MLRERWGLITSRRIIFTPSVDLKDELATTGILITCYDRTGKEVKRVTSTSGEVEDSDSGGSGTVTEENGSGRILKTISPAIDFNLGAVRPKGCPQF